VSNKVAIPAWLVPTALTMVIFATGLTVRSFAADEAEALDAKHLKIIRPDIVRLEKDVAAIRIKQAKYDGDIANIKEALSKATKITTDNHDIIIRIAAKLDVEQ